MNSTFGGSSRACDWEFHKNFTFVSAEERAVECVKCTLRRSTSEKGTLFLTPVRLAFLSQNGARESVCLEEIDDLLLSKKIFKEEIRVTTNLREIYIFHNFRGKNISSFVQLFVALSESRRSSVTFRLPSGFRSEGSLTESNEDTDLRSSSYRSMSMDGGESFPVNNNDGESNIELKSSLMHIEESSDREMYRCTLLSESSCAGTMYFKENKLLFVNREIPLKKIISVETIANVEKVNFMFVVLALKIQLKNGSSTYFSDLLNRDATYDTIQQMIAEVNASKTEDSPRPSSVGQINISDMQECPSRDSLSTVETDFGTGLSNYNCFEKPLIEPIDLPVGKTLLDVFEIGFSDSSRLLEKYHTERGDVKQVHENWRPTKDGGTCRGQRLFKCMTPVKLLFGKFYPFSEFQRYCFLSVNEVPTLMLQFSSQVTGILCGDAFRPETLIVFTQEGNGETARVHMEVYGYVQFIRDVWVKKKILKNTLDIELPEGYSRLSQLLIENLSTMVSSLSTTPENVIQPSLPEPVAVEKEKTGPSFPFDSITPTHFTRKVVLLMDIIVIIRCLFVFFYKFFVLFPSHLDGPSQTVGIALVDFCTEAMNGLVLIFGAQYAYGLLTYLIELPRRS